MQFHDLGAQYRALKSEIDAGIAEVLKRGISFWASRWASWRMRWPGTWGGAFA